MGKLTKADVYAAHGIEYKGGKIRAPWGAWITPLLTIGTNSKVGNAATWSTVHGTETITAETSGPKTRAAMHAAGVPEITGTCPCHCDGCYCDGGRYRMDGVRAALVIRTIIARFHVDFMRRAITAQIHADGIMQCRIHAAGDFFGPAYTAAWRDITADCPGCTFWTYTKARDAMHAFDDAENVSVVPSLTPAGINYGTCADVLKKRDALTAAGHRVHVCACGTPSEKHCADCVHGCKAIGTECDYVLFILHSVAWYHAGENDPDAYAELCDVVKRQEN